MWEDDYEFARLTPGDFARLRSLEQELSTRYGRRIVLIAYETGELYESDDEWPVIGDSTDGETKGSE